MPEYGKVLLLVENCSVPNDNRVWPEAIALRNHGYQVSVICPKGIKEDREAYACVEGIHIYRYTLPMARSFTGYFAEYLVALSVTFALSWRVLARHGFDVVHAANPPDILFIIGLVYRLLGKKYVFDQHDPAPELFQVRFQGRSIGRTGALLKALLRLLEWCSYQTASAVIVSNHSQKRFAVTRGRCPENKVFVVRNGPNTVPMIEPRSEAVSTMCRQYVLAYVGVMGIQDGVEYALHAIHTLVHCRGRHDVSLVLMGDGDAAPELRVLTHRLELDDYVTFTGWVTKETFTTYLARSDIGLVPDPENGLNEYCTIVKTMDYMSLSKPIVAFDLTETRFTAQDAALYASPNRVDEFASQIEILLNNDALRVKMGAAGRRRIDDELSWVRSTEQLALAYKRLSM